MSTSLPLGIATTHTRNLRNCSWSLCGYRHIQVILDVNAKVGIYSNKIYCPLAKGEQQHQGQASIWEVKYMLYGGQSSQKLGALHEIPIQMDTQKHLACSPQARMPHTCSTTILSFSTKLCLELRIQFL